jgi:hypothetical protein
MSRIRNSIFLLILFAATILVAAGCEGMVASNEQRNRRVAAITDIEERQITDDWDEFWFFDKNLKLTEWQVYIGD